jgi:type II secretory pathway pseudopilin PulG
MKKIIAMLKGKDQRGISVILVAMLLTVLVGFVAFAIDIGYTYVARNQVQNAADAGALAGARFLIKTDGTINGLNDAVTGPSANQIAYNTATSNTSTGNPVTVNWTVDTNGLEVQRGHWSFATSTFTPNANLTQTSNIFLPGPALDLDPNFINAVKVVTHNAQIPSFFGRIFGWSNYQTSADAVAYLGFGSRFAPGDFDQPIAICSRSIGDDNNNGMIDDPDPSMSGEDGEETLTCNIGRMLNSSGDPQTSNTAGWTNFSQPCATANPPSVNPLICSGGNDVEVNSGSMGTTGGVDQSILTPMRNCWLSKAPDELDALGAPGSDGKPDKPWSMTLPVILCTGNNVANCSEIVGAVNVNVVWITEGGTGQVTAPNNMVAQNDAGELISWQRVTGQTDEQAWPSFATAFNLLNQDGSAAPLDNKSIYFMPSCSWSNPVGTTGGNFFGVMAEVPVLVE